MKQVKRNTQQLCHFAGTEAFKKFVRHSEASGLLTNPYQPDWRSSHQDCNLLEGMDADDLDPDAVDTEAEGHLLIVINRDGCDERLAQALPAVANGLLSPKCFKAVVIFINLATGQVLACGAGDKGQVFLHDAFTHRPVELGDDYMAELTRMDHANLVEHFHGIVSEFSEACYNFFLASSSFECVDARLSEAFSGYPGDALDLCKPFELPMNP